ncbi:MAG: hypothetical protein N2444_06155, partial [Methylocystis sp.]|nr:hypothetical protein [Methylocystis sp.]
SRRVALGHAPLDAQLGGGLVRAGLHEVYARSGADAVAATGFALALARRAAGARRPIVWVRQDMMSLEAGQPYPQGLSEIGVEPAAIVFLRLRDAKEALQAGAEAGRCAGVGATLIEIFGRARALDLTASRRLALAAGASGAPVFLIRAGAAPVPSAAATRWLVRASPSRALNHAAFERNRSNADNVIASNNVERAYREKPASTFSQRALLANAPGSPVFDITLLRQRGGMAEQEWRVEWNRDRVCFELCDDSRRPDAAPLSRPLAPFAADGAVAA